jgi:raffinose/stachyose/melibiose transport system permease protein
MKKITAKSLFYLGILLMLALWLLPLFFVLVTSLKTNMQFYTTPIFQFPDTIYWENFYKAFISSKLYLYMKNGLIVCLIKVPLELFLASFTAFALTRLKIKHSNAIFVFILVGMMIPLQAMLLPITIATGRLNMMNNHWSLIIIYLGTGLPFGVLVMRGFMRGIPTALDESARIDGCSNLRLYASIILPLAKPAVATLTILDFLYSWNEFLFSSIIVSSNLKRTVAPGILVFYGETVVDYPKLCAGILILVIPVLIVFLIFQRYFVEGMAGAIKG